MNNLSATARPVKILKQGKKENIGTMKKKNGKYTDNPEETLKILLDTHFPDLEVETEPEQPIEADIADLDDDAINSDKVVNKEAIQAAIKTFKP